MNENLNVLRLVDGVPCWYAAGGAAAQPLTDADTLTRFRELLAAQRAPVFAVPGEDVRLLELHISPEELRHLDGALPFMLEERVAVDIDTLHVARHQRGKFDITAMLCERAKMENWQQALAAAPGVNQWVPEPLLLPWYAGEWCLLLESGRGVLRYGEGAGTAVERELLPALLEALHGELPAPQKIVVYGADQAADTALFAEPLQPLVQWRRGDFTAALLLDAAPQQRPNLLQGSFAPRLPLQRWWQQWRLVAGVVAAAFALQMLATWTDYERLSRENLLLREAVQERYREAYPRGAVVDAEKQLQRQLAGLRGSAQGDGFVALLEQVGSIVAAQAGTTIASINYSERGGEMRMNILAPDFAAVEQLRSGLTGAGLATTMESSTTSGTGVRARLRVGGAT